MQQSICKFKLEATGKEENLTGQEPCKNLTLQVGFMLKKSTQCGWGGGRAGQRKGPGMNRTVGHSHSSHGSHKSLCRHEALFAAWDATQNSGPPPPLRPSAPARTSRGTDGNSGCRSRGRQEKYGHSPPLPRGHGRTSGLADLHPSP